VKTVIHHLRTEDVSYFGNKGQISVENKRVTVCVKEDDILINILFTKHLFQINN
jgi:hypothetical protein